MDDRLHMPDTHRQGKGRRSTLAAQGGSLRQTSVSRSYVRTGEHARRPRLPWKWKIANLNVRHHISESALLLCAAEGIFS